MIVIVSPNKNGKIELTKQQLQEYLEQAKEEGAKEERNRQINRISEISSIPFSNPIGTTGNPPINWDKFTCTSYNPENEIIATAQQGVNSHNDEISKLANTNGHSVGRN